MDAPKVTGLSPLEGPPGTKITIRGENLGVSQKDLAYLSICGVDCTMYAEWISPSKILARTRSGMDKGDVIVTTLSGGEGTCTVQFRGIQEPVGPTIESAVWVDESQFAVVNYGQSRATSPQLIPEDPLGLSDEGNAEKYPESKLLDLFPRGSGNILVDNFAPAWYLLENHHGTSFLDMKAGLKCLSRKVTQHKEGPLSFLKSNVMAIVDCLENLSTLQNWLIKDRQELGNELTNKLDEAIQNSSKEAVDIFEDVLSRKDKADSMRNALSVLQRFRFLFNLPANLEKNIQQGEYDIVINDYARAKFLFKDTQVSVFKKVYQEVDQRIDKFRILLTEKLKTFPCPFDEQKKLIKHLVNLEAPGNPAWDCVSNTHVWLNNIMNNCKDNHLTQIGNDCDSATSSPEYTPDAPQVVQFGEEVSAIFQKHFPEFWKLGQAYLAGDLVIRDPQNSDKMGIPKSESFRNMVHDLTQRVCNLIRAALLPHTLRNIPIQQLRSYGTWPKSLPSEALGPWLTYCIRFVRQCYSTLLKLDLSEEVLSKFQQLLFDLRVHSMSGLFSHATEEVQGFHTRETWVVEMDDKNGGTTQLPLLFENRVVETLQLVRENVVLCGPKEVDMFSQFHMQANIKQLSQSLLHSFAEALSKLAHPETNEPSSPDNETRNQNNICLNREMTENLDKDEKILIVLSNCNFTRKSLIPRLLDSFTKHGYPDMSLVIKGAQAKYRDLERELFETYQGIKCEPLVGMMETGMYAGKFDWYHCQKPTGVSVYVKRTITSMIAVHADVISLTPPSMPQVMTKVVEAAVEEMTRLYECVRKFGRYGNVQATLDIRAFEESISAFATNVTSKNFMVCRSKLEPFHDVKDRELVEHLLNQFRNNMRLQLLCFKEDSVVTV